MKQRKWMALLLVLSTLIALFPAWEDVTTAEAAITSSACPFGGEAERIGSAGCSYCGGKGIKYNNKAPGGKASIGYEDGDGYQVSHTEETEYGVVEYRYRCENCGDTGYNCKRFDEFIGACYIAERPSKNGGAFNFVWIVNTKIQKK